jgi:hypothetical protein
MKMNYPLKKISKILLMTLVDADALVCHRKNGYAVSVLAEVGEFERLLAVSQPIPDLCVVIAKDPRAVVLDDCAALHTAYYHFCFAWGFSRARCCFSWRGLR